MKWKFAPSRIPTRSSADYQQTKRRVADEHRCRRGPLRAVAGAAKLKKLFLKVGQFLNPAWLVA